MSKHKDCKQMPLSTSLRKKQFHGKNFKEPPLIELMYFVAGDPCTDICSWSRRRRKSREFPQSTEMAQ